VEHIIFEAIDAIHDNFAPKAASNRLTLSRSEVLGHMYRSFGSYENAGLAIFGVDK